MEGRVLRRGVGSVFAAVGACLFVVTASVPEWIEVVSGVDPDGGSGVLEVAVAMGFLLVAVVVEVVVGLDPRPSSLGSLRSRLGTPFWAAGGAAMLSLLAFVAAVLWQDWIEVVLRVDPDGGNGEVERFVAVACAVGAVAFGLLADRRWRRAGAVGLLSGSTA
jgi:hypothetical protein